MAVKFNWDASVLTRDTLDVEFESGKVTFREFSKSKCDAFIKAATNAKLTEEYDVETEVPGPNASEKTVTKVVKATRFIRVADCLDQQTELINTWLAEATDGAKDKKFFDNLCEDISSTAYGRLTEAVLFDLSHVDDILAVRGNYLRLPEVFELARAAAAAATLNPSEPSTEIKSIS